MISIRPCRLEVAEACYQAIMESINPLSRFVPAPCAKVC